MLREAHFIVLPTNYDMEAQPVSIMEGMAFGCVPIATNYRAIPDLIQDGVTGRLVRYNDPREIAGAIAEFAGDPVRFRRMSAAAQEFCLRNFTISNHVRRMLDVLGVTAC